MGCGKSTVGKTLARIKNIPFIDLDQYIEDQQNMSVRELFKAEGELKFRKLEQKALLELIEANTPAVIALGGGTPCYFDNMEKIIAQFRKEMCAKMKEHIIKKYSAETNRTIQNARLKYPSVYKKHLPQLKENMQRIITGLNDLCPVDKTNRYFDEKLVSGLMDPIVVQMQREIDSAAPATISTHRVGGANKKTRKNGNKTHRGNTSKGKTFKGRRRN